MEPIAIIGMGCRFPGGVNTASQLWQLVRDGVDAIGDAPLERFNAERLQERIASRKGGFLEQVDRFDARFFQLSPRETNLMDPQQRLLLEVAWEALEDGGQVPEKLPRHATGVFVGMWTNDYELRMYEALPELDVHATTGGGRYAASGRLSYFLDVRGPSLTVDTACSSSLVAVHLACQSLRQGECQVALVGASNLILEPYVTLAYSRSTMLSPDGRSKFGDARANGYVRSEGVAVLVLKPLSQALREGDPIRAVIRGSAVNNDGQSSGHLVTPGREGQQALLREAYRAAGVEPSRVGYVEAHGTGTRAGDPIELGALASVLGENRERERPCFVGSVKTNIGHTEGAAGLAGMMKVVMALQHRAIPPSLHFQTPNPQIPWDELPVVIPQALTPWPGAEPALAGVSAFGITGTNAHVVLEEAPRPAAPPRPVREDEAFLLPLSAHAPEALEALAGAWRSLLSEPRAERVEELCFTASVRRGHHAHRLAVVGRSREELAERLDAHLRGEARPGTSTGMRAELPLKPVFVFPGQGSQWPGMGRRLLEQEPVFREALEACEAAFAHHVSWRLLEVLRAWPASPLLERIDVIQPVLFALQVALAALWRSWGVRPHAVVGHSMGEVAAAHVAGILSLQDAALIICQRSLLLRRTSGQGAMALVELSLDEARLALRGFEDALSVAVSNGPRSTVLSGDPAALQRVLDSLQRRDVFCRLVKVDVASHSPQMDPLREELLQVLQGLTPRAGELPFYSTVRAQVLDGATLGPAYWVDNLRQPVLFFQAVEQLLTSGHDVFLELSPHPILLPSIEQAVRAGAYPARVLPSLVRQEDERPCLLGSLGALYSLGLPVDWTRLHPETSTRQDLPPYPWQRERFWFQERASAAPRSRPGVRGEHPLLGAHLQSSLSPGTHFFEAELSCLGLPALSDHRVHGQGVLPAAAYLEAALAAARTALGPGPLTLSEVRFTQALVLPESDALQVQWVLDGSAFHASSRATATSAWVRHASATLVPAASVPRRPDTKALASLQSRIAPLTPSTALYAALAQRGLQYGPAFQRLARLGCLGAEALAELHPAEADSTAWLLHPTLLDACFQLVLASLSPEAGYSRDATFLPVSLERLSLYETPRPGASLWAHSRLRPAEPGAEIIAGDLLVLDDQGRLLAEAVGLHFQRVAADVLRTLASRAGRDGRYELQWRPVRRPSPPAEWTPGAWLVFADARGVGTSLVEKLAARGERCVVVTPGPDWRRLSEDGYALDPARPEHFQQLLREAFDSAPRGVVHLWSLDAAGPESTSLESLERALLLGSGGVLHLVQAFSRAGWNESPRLWLVTRGTQAVSGEEKSFALAQAPLWGVGKALAHEHPELRCTCVDLDASGDEAFPLEELDADDTEDQVALRGGTRYSARLARSTPPDSARALAGRIRPDATYLLTGGLGGLGLEVARWLVEQGARHLVLVGRGEPSGEAARALEALRSAGARVHLARADVSRLEALTQALQALGRELPPVRGIVHAAGILDDGTLANLNLERLRRAMSPKVEGAWNLHTLHAGQPLDFFVLFSSVVSVLGSPGQGNYAAGNAFLDALAHHLRAHGVPALSINWGPWSEVGLAARPDRGTRLEGHGLGPLSPPGGVESLAQVLFGARAQVAVMRFDAGAWRQHYPTAARTHLLDELASPQDAATPPPRPTEALRQTLLAAEPGWRRRAQLESHLKAQIAQVLKLSPSRIDARTPLRVLGFDSLMTLELRNRLEASLELKLSATVLWNYPTLEGLVPYLAERMQLSPEPESAPSAAPTPASEPPPPAVEASAVNLNAMLGELDGLSDEDVMNLLSGSTHQS
ncbi:type I polyketide synthase [Melittangium boletus]|uniref:Polyketide synthase n=1 Tax=Melittangium boletus DSM 14713 TaxID=1294270 RepID=A0A250IML3_9BACT|nr:type I polyketide synthase [Melittangium boletus]ATB32462.1 polyketide synthase [Melittangium boletus DSM 14713]